MLQLYPAYLLCNRCKTLTGSPDPTHANGMNKPCSVEVTKTFLWLTLILQDALCTFLTMSEDLFPDAWPVILFFQTTVSSS